MALDYGYVIRIQSNGVSDPSHTPTNQWQRKLEGQPEFSDLPGQINETYTVDRTDQSAQLRLQQIFSGTKAYSNELQVTSAEPAGRWVFKGELLRNGVQCLGYYKPDKLLIASGRNGVGKKSTDDGDTWSNYSHAVDVPICTFPISSNQTVWSGYGGGRSDDNVYWDNNGSKSWSSGFTNGTYVYGAAKLKDGSFIATDISGFVWEASSLGGAFTKTSIQLDSYSVTLQGDLASDGGVFGTGAGKVWKIMGLNGSTLNFTSATLPFGSSSGSVVCPIAEHNGLYVCGGDSASIFWSTNFTSWTKSSSPASIFPSGARITGVSYAGGKWWATAGYTGTLYLVSSINGKEWVRESLPSGVSGYNNPKMIGYDGTAIWTMDTSVSPYTTYYCVIE